MRILELIFLFLTFKVKLCFSIGILKYFTGYIHNNFFSVKNSKNLHFCVPEGSEYCGRALEFRIADNASFECTNEVNLFIKKIILKLILYKIISIQT